MICSSRIACEVWEACRTSDTGLFERRHFIKKRAEGREKAGENRLYLSVLFSLSINMEVM